MYLLPRRQGTSCWWSPFAHHRCTTTELERRAYPPAQVPARLSNAGEDFGHDSRSIRLERMLRATATRPCLSVVLHNRDREPRRPQRPERSTEVLCGHPGCLLLLCRLRSGDDELMWPVAPLSLSHFLACAGRFPFTIVSFLSRLAIYNLSLDYREIPSPNSRPFRFPIGWPLRASGLSRHHPASAAP